MLTNGLRRAGTDFLIQCLRPGVQCVVRGKSSDTTHVFPPDFSRYPSRAGSTLAELTGSHDLSYRHEICSVALLAVIIVSVFPLL